MSEPWAGLPAALQMVWMFLAFVLSVLALYGFMLVVWHFGRGRGWFED